jgi:ADP-heptose:LPS heptosyltransferase/GT2 family glycosyltransferase
MARELFVLRLNAHAGDVLMARPVLGAFRRAHPRARIYFETDRKYHGLMDGCRDVDFVRTLFASHGHENEIDLCEFKRRPWAHRRIHLMDQMAEACGVRVQDRSYGFRPSADDDRWAEAEEAAKAGPFAAVHATSASPAKDWDVRALGEVVRALKADPGLPVIQVGSAGDAPVEGAKDYRGKMSFGKAAALIARASLFIGPDSLPMHLSRTVREVPAIALWGGTSPLTSGLFGGSVVNIEPVRECGHDGRPCYTRCDSDRHCMGSIDPALVVSAARRLLDPAPRPDVTVILVNWNSWARFTHPTIYQLERTMRSDWDFILADNGSKEDGPHLRTWSHPKLSGKVLYPENRGLPKAWNEAARLARGRVILFLNTDIKILREGWDLEALALLARHPEAGIVGVSENEPPCLFGPGFEKETLPFVAGQETRCHHVNGSAMFVRRAALDRIGPFDERYTPGYCEETDFCLRACLMGTEVWHLGGLVHHEGHAVTAKLNKMSLGPVIKRNGEYFRKKWEGATAPAIPAALAQEATL